MTGLLGKLSDSARGLFERQPILALAMGGALVTVFLLAVLKSDRDVAPSPATVAWALYRNVCRIVWGLVLVAFLSGATSALRSYLAQVKAHFRHTHGRITQVNLRAVRTIWGVAQAQRELLVDLGYDVEETERLESEDPTRPALLRKVRRRHSIRANPFIAARHTVILK